MRQIGDTVLFPVNPDESRERRTGTVTAIVGDLLTIDADGESFECLDALCISVGIPLP